MLHRILDVSPLPDYRLRLRYEDGTSGEIDCQPLIVRGGVYVRLASPGAFRQVSISGSGRYLEWPGNVDFCADALYEELQNNAGKSPADARSA